MKVNESDDVGLDIAFHIVDKVNNVLLSALRVACRATTSSFLWPRARTSFITARLKRDLSSACGSGTVSHPDEKLITFNAN